MRDPAMSQGLERRGQHLTWLRRGLLVLASSGLGACVVAPVAEYEVGTPQVYAGVIYPVNYSAFAPDLVLGFGFGASYVYSSPYFLSPPVWSFGVTGWRPARPVYGYRPWPVYRPGAGYSTHRPRPPAGSRPPQQRPRPPAAGPGLRPGGQPPALSNRPGQRPGARPRPPATQGPGAAQQPPRAPRPQARPGPRDRPAAVRPPSRPEAVPGQMRPQGARPPAVRRPASATGRGVSPSSGGSRPGGPSMPRSGSGVRGRP